MAAKEHGVAAREALETLSKEELVSRAEALGIDGARKFTKLELVDEISRAVGAPDRGLLGKARDLLRDVVERGLARASSAASSKRDASETKGDGAAEDPTAKTVEQEGPVPTVTLAEIYLAQGHTARAKSILLDVVREHPEDDAARALLARLGAEVPVEPKAEPRAEATAPSDPFAKIGLEPEAFVEPQAERYPEVPSMLDDAPLPHRYDVDECVALAVDPTTVYVYWEARRSTVERALRALRASSTTSTLRVLVVEPNEQGPNVSTRDFEIVDLEYGEWFIRDLPGGAIVRCAIGLRAGERFLPIAHTLDVEAPAATPSNAIAREYVVWSETGTRPLEEGPRGMATPLARDAGLLGLPPMPVSPGDDDDAAFGRGLSSAELARRRRVSKGRPAGGQAGEGRGEHGGASDLLARGPTSASWSSGR